MTVAVDDDIDPGGFGFQIECSQIMHDVDRDPRGLDQFGFRQVARPCFLIDIAANDGEGSQTRKLGENLGRAHVTRMNDVLGSTQRFDRLRTKQAVSIGDHADQLRGRQFPVLSSRNLNLPHKWFVEGHGFSRAAKAT